VYYAIVTAQWNSKPLKKKKIGTKFCFNLERLASETYEMLKRAFPDDTLSRTPL